jgi:hypothetical protein
MPLHIINGDILNMDNVEYIVHQVNCLTVQSHGLSESISMKYPWADVHAQRRNITGRYLAIAKDRDIPGTIRIFKNPSHTPHVICLFGQYDFGTPRYQQRVFDFKDSSENREHLFYSCLKHISELKPISAALSWGICCSLDGGNWERYYSMIVNLSSHCDVTLVYNLMYCYQ